LLLVLMLFSGCTRDIDLIESVYQGLFSDIDLTKVVSDLDFPSHRDGVDISWKSSNPDVLSDTGEVNRLSADVVVEVQIILKAGKATEIRKLLITILKQEPADEPEEPIDEPEEPIDEPEDPDEDPVDPDYAIGQALSKSDGSTVTVQGLIIGIIGQSAILHDGEDGINLYLLGGSYAIGNEIRVTGKLAEFHGLKQLEDLSDISVISASATLPNARSVTAFSQITTQNTFYSISEVTVTKLPESYPLDKNIFLKVKDSANQEMEIIISKYIPDDEVRAIQNKLKNVRVGDKIGLNKVISGYYDAWQLQVLEAGNFIVSEKPVEAVDAYPEGLDDLQDVLEEEYYVGLPSIGTSRVLIIPIAFTDYNFNSADLLRLEKAFFGTSEETGWESVYSYYQKSSYQQFTLQGEILEVFQTGKSSLYYNALYMSGQDADYEIIEDLMAYYDDEIDFSEYDLNDDGYIDGLYLIYAAPVEWDAESLYWAYSYQYLDEGEEYDGVEVNYYLWAGIDFMDEPIIYGWDEEDDVRIAVNAATYIHETGHMLGLDDYYDYDEDRGPDGGLGGADMMDSTIGDHNPFSKLMLSWITPRVISNKTVTLEIEAFVQSGEVILIAPSWEDTYFDEYFLIDFYTPTSLNALHSGNGLFSESGIRIYHVDATIDPKVGNPQNEDGYWTVFSYNNSDTTEKLIELIEADRDRSIEKYGTIENEDLFQEGDIFGGSAYANYRLNDGSLLNFTVEIVDITATTATITITFN
jgi:M6 family metalloprotease-like protein